MSSFVVDTVRAVVSVFARFAQLACLRIRPVSWTY